MSVACAIGDTASPLEWLKDKGSYDTMLRYFGNHSCRYEHTCDMFVHVKSRFKLENIAYGLESFSDVLSRYDYFMFPDDDCRLRVRDIERLFGAMERFQIDAGHPAVLYRSHHVDLFPRLSLHHRRVKAIEMMCPIVTRDVLERIVDTFTINRSGFGIDLLWGSILHKEGKTVAIFDSLPIFHFRDDAEPGALYQKALESSGIDPFAEAKELNVSFDDFSICYERIAYNSSWPVTQFLKGLIRAVMRSIELGCFLGMSENIIKMNWRRLRRRLLGL